jgi:preprotein translocase subunit YajC
MFLITDAHAQGLPGTGDSGMMSIFFMVAIFVVFYFLMIRPQVKRQKEHKSMVDALGRGDEVLTSGGIVGRISELGEQYVTLQIAAVNDKPVEISMQRSAIQTLLPKGTIKGGAMKGTGAASGAGGKGANAKGGVGKAPAIAAAAGASKTASAANDASGSAAAAIAPGVDGASGSESETTESK